MKLTTIEAKTLPEAWFLCLKACLESGYEYVIDRGSHKGGRRKEFDFIMVRVEYPNSRPIIPETPIGVPPVTSMEYIESYMPYLMDYIKRPNEQYTYGQDLGYQILEVIDMYKKDGSQTNQACMAVGDKYSIRLSDPQCLRIIDTRVRYGKLHFIVYFRSWDLWAGFPSNLAAIQLLKEYMASEIGVKDGELIACSKGLHLYDYTWEYAKQVVYR
jgi:thymidylate synthase